jgi:hypothetical protein
MREVGATGRTRSTDVGSCVRYNIDIHIYMKGFNEKLTSKLTNSMEHSLSSKASCLSSSQILHLQWNWKLRYLVFKSPQPIDSIPTLYLDPFWRYPHLGLLNNVFPWGSETKTLCAGPCMLYWHVPAISFCHQDDSRWRIMKLLIKQFLPASVTSSVLGQNMLTILF